MQKIEKIDDVIAKIQELEKMICLAIHELEEAAPLIVRDICVIRGTVTSCPPEGLWGIGLVTEFRRTE